MFEETITSDIISLLDAKLFAIKKEVKIKAIDLLINKLNIQKKILLNE